MKQIRFTKDGFTKLQAEYEALQKERPLAVEDLAKARAMGDLSENGYYKAARSKLSSIDWQLQQIKTQLKQAVILENTTAGVVNINTTVTLKNNNEHSVCHIVGDLEADPKIGKISLYSPIGRAIAGKKAGDEVTVTIPSGTIRYTITNIAIKS